MNSYDEEDNDDDAPLEVSKKDSEQQAKENLKQEKLAKNFFDEKIKRKRRQELQRNVEQKKQKIEKLPEKFFEEIETELNNATNDSKISTAILKKNKREKKKLAKAKKFVTRSTKYEIVSLNEFIKTSKAPILQTEACNFREKILFDKNKKSRQSSRKVMSIRQKIRACTK